MSEQWQLFMSMETGVHINGFTQISHRWYRAEDRVTVSFEGTNMARLTLYLPREELLRLRDTLAAIALEIEDERKTLPPGMTNSAA
jgi:hypothetical protein